jgi:hypothetical protein
MLKLMQIQLRKSDKSGFYLDGTMMNNGTSTERYLFLGHLLQLTFAERTQFSNAVPNLQLPCFSSQYTSLENVSKVIESRNGNLEDQQLPHDYWYVIIVIIIYDSAISIIV